MTDIESLFAYVDMHTLPYKIDCLSCDYGRVETECCNGYGGCPCRGGRVDMGTCLVCHGKGFYYSDEQVNVHANWQNMNTPFPGGGPRNIADWRPFISQ